MEENKIRITVSGVLEDLSNGYTRTTTSKHYNAEIGSIEEKYGLNKTEVSQLFKHPKLLGKQTILQKEIRFIIVDDTVIEESTIEDSENGEESLSTDNANDTITSEEQLEEELKEIPVGYEPSAFISPLKFD